MAEVQRPAHGCQKTGRPGMLSPARVALIVARVRRGLPLATAAVLAGVSRTTAYRWLRRGERDDEPEFVEFAREVRRAEADAAERLHDRVLGAAMGLGPSQASALAARWVLAMRWPRYYGTRATHAAAISDPAPAVVVLQAGP